MSDVDFDSEENLSRFGAMYDNNSLRVRHGGECWLASTSTFGVMPRTTAANRRRVDVLKSGMTMIGHRCVIGCYSVLYADVILGSDCRIGDHAVIREGTRIGDRCVIGTNVDVQYGCLIGDDVRILNGSHISGGTVIGDGTFIGPGVMTANDNLVDPANYRDNPDRKAPIIGRNVMIGVGAILLPCVTIGDGARIGAGAVVTKDVPADDIVFGMPARARRSLAAVDRSDFEGR